jgi:nucleoside-diphosphate-sugar epimerase
MDPEMPIDIVHEDDVALGFHAAIHHDVNGAVNLGSGSPMLYRELAEMCGQKIVKIPRTLLRTVADVAFRFGFSKSSSHWVNLSSYPIIPSIELAAKELDWRPRHTGKQSLQAMLDAANASRRK